MSHRYNRLPLLPSGPGGFSRSWSHPFAECKGNKQLELIRNYNSEMGLK